MTLALVIPVWNDQANLDKLLDQTLNMGVFDQIVVVDDGSIPEITLPDMSDGRVTLLRRATSGGAGAARNTGLAAVTTDHLLFFDSDDLLTDQFPLLWQEVADKPFDFCLFRYHDSERGALGGWGQIPHDDARWRLARAEHRALQPVTDDARWILAEASNFPWNKLYRTAFLRQHDLRCTETQVHNDIELHWRSFALARDILVSDRIAAKHIVHPGGSRLTNRKGTERLKVFLPLRQAAQQLEAQAALPQAWLAFLRFANGLLTWIERVLHPDLHPDLHHRTRLFLGDILPGDRFDRLAEHDPVLALRLCSRMWPETPDSEVPPCLD